MSTQLYLISPPNINLEEFAELLNKVLALKVVKVFQLRLKDCNEEQLLNSARTLLSVCHKHGIQFILNDYPDLAHKIGADGVHIGEEANYKDARTIIGSNKIIGVSCYDSIDRAIDFAEKGADYVSFGAFFPTTTKIAKATPKPEIIKHWVTNSIVPCVAIGGINLDNAKILVDQGADFIAVISSVWNSKDPLQAIRDLSKICDSI